MQKQYLIKNLEDWNALADDLASELGAGSIIALSGPLGAGKTTFVQALARALGSSVSPRSPTFSLMRTYRLHTGGGERRSPLQRLIHVDAYRLEKPMDILSLNLDEECSEPGTVLVIEWPENVKEWLERQKGGVYRMTISLEEGEGRKVVVDSSS